MNVDPYRIYVAGHSNGGFMSYRLACTHADRIAAIVSLAGATFDTPADCSPTEPVAVLQIHGTADDTCPIRWSEATVKALKAAGKDVTFVKYRGEGHTFDRQWQRSIERSVAFFDKHLE